jgi:aspartate carbamoyltransferase regulatory subunit
MIIDSIQNGVVIDHITAGKAMELYRILRLDELDCTVAILKNVVSARMGKKDIIKVDTEFDLNMDVLGYTSPNITVDVIRDGQVMEKKHIDPPERLVDIIKCKNPRCITSTEQELHHIFRLSDPKKGVYRCIYCDTKAT